MRVETFKCVRSNPLLIPGAGAHWNTARNDAGRHGKSAVILKSHWRDLYVAFVFDLFSYLYIQKKITHIFIHQKKKHVMASNNFAHATRKSMAMGPSVRNLLSHYNLDPARITSTGPYQTLLKSDVLSYINQNKLSPNQDNGQHQQQSSSVKSQKSYVPNLDLSGHQPKAGPEGFSKIAKRLLDM